MISKSYLKLAHKTILEIIIYLINIVYISIIPIISINRIYQKIFFILLILFLDQF